MGTDQPRPQRTHCSHGVSLDVPCQPCDDGVEELKRSFATILDQLDDGTRRWH